jgi:hypothetical protein
MTQDVGILSIRAAELAEELRAHLADTFKIAVRVRQVATGRGFRIYQLRQPKNRHLADVRQVEQLPPTQLIADIPVPTPEELIAQKVVSLSLRSAQPKGDTDRRDLKLLLLAHPALKSESGPVLRSLEGSGADAAALKLWKDLVATEIAADETHETDD